MTAASETLADALSDAIGPQKLSLDPSRCALFGQDIFFQGAAVAMVVRPTGLADIIAVLRISAEHSAKVTLRGGGMSYSGGYLAPEAACVVALDLAGMNAVREINAADLYAIVEGGCTWSELDAALAPLDLRAAYWGTLSGRRATVGGSISQNAIFWGAGHAGCAADNVLGLEVVTGDGHVMRTGSMGVAGSNGFFRHFGPDITGLFTSDAGAFGVKTAIALRLEPRPALQDGISILVPDQESLCELMGQVARSGLAAQQMALDDGLKTARMTSATWRDIAATARGVFQNVGHPVTGLVRLARMALAGKEALNGMPYSLHLFIEADSRGVMNDKLNRLRALSSRFSTREVPPAVPHAMLATPFPPLNAIVGPKGERWVPMHAVLPLSRALAGLRTMEAAFSRHATAMAKNGISHSWLFTTIGRNAFVIEPMLFWADELSALHRDVLGERRMAKISVAAPQSDASALVARIRADVVEAADTLGALHIQIGSYYQYLSRLYPEGRGLVGQLSSLLDPNSVLNPSALRGSCRNGERPPFGCCA